MITKLRWIIVEAWLRSINKWANDRIRSGDLDFDDTIYKSKDASGVLLGIWFTEGKP